MTGYVVDASVAAKWYLPADDEPLKKQAMEIVRRYARGDCQFYVPGLFFAEFANILWKAERLGRCSPRTSDRAVEAILGLGLPTYATTELVKPARVIARSFQRPVYDSLYVALAIEKSAIFVSADKRLVNAVGGRLPVQWLGAPTLL